LESPLILGMIAADGPTSVSAEMTLPNKPEDWGR
jgi:hypothetical protein